MSTSICQGLQSCLQPGVIEPRVLRLKLALPNSNLSLSTPWNKPDKLEGQDHHQNDDINEFHDVNKKKIKKGVDKNDNNDDMMKNDGLSFLQALTAKNDTGTEYVYVHPMVKRSASMLSAKSLEMCTESLGSETGSDTGDSSGDEMSMLSAAATATVTARQRPGAREVVLSPPKRLSCSRSFPPPLNSVSGSAGFHVRPHREDGRLVLKAVAVASSSGLFHAERADGRLTLRLMNNFNPKNEEEEDDEEEEVESEIESEEAYEEEDDDEEGNGEEEETEEVKMEAEKIQRPSRCKEDGHGKNNVLMNWEQLLVAT